MGENGEISQTDLISGPDIKLAQQEQNETDKYSPILNPDTLKIGSPEKKRPGLFGRLTNRFRKQPEPSSNPVPSEKFSFPETKTPPEFIDDKQAANEWGTTEQKQGEKEKIYQIAKQYDIPEDTRQQLLDQNLSPEEAAAYASLHASLRDNFKTPKSQEFTREDWDSFQKDIAKETNIRIDKPEEVLPFDNTPLRREVAGADAQTMAEAAKVNLADNRPPIPLDELPQQVNNTRTTIEKSKVIPFKKEQKPLPEKYKKVQGTSYFHDRYQVDMAYPEGVFEFTIELAQNTPDRDKFMLNIEDKLSRQKRHRVLESVYFRKKEPASDLTEFIKTIDGFWFTATRNSKGELIKNYQQYEPTDGLLKLLEPLEDTVQGNVQPISEIVEQKAA